MNDARLNELRQKYKDRNLLEELGWGAYANHSGYTSKHNGEFLNWLCNEAYRELKKTQPEPCEDAVSREAVLDALRTCYDTETITYDNGDEYIHYGDAVGEVEQLPPVTPKQGTGEWIEDKGQQILMQNFIERGEVWRVCSVCGAGHMIGHKYASDKAYHNTFHNFCPNCGAKME